MSIYVGSPPPKKPRPAYVAGVVIGATARLASAGLIAWLVVEAILWIRRQP